MIDYEVVDEVDVILFIPIDQSTQTEAQLKSQEFWSDPCWSQEESE